MGDGLFSASGSEVSEVRWRGLGSRTQDLLECGLEVSRDNNDTVRFVMTASGFLHAQEGRAPAHEGNVGACESLGGRDQTRCELVTVDSGGSGHQQERP